MEAQLDNPLEGIARVAGSGLPVASNEIDGTLRRGGACSADGDFAEGGPVAAQPDEPFEEIERLRRRMNDLVEANKALVKENAERRQAEEALRHVLLADIERLKRAEDAIRTSERNLDQTINAIPVMAWCNLPDGSNEFLNQPWHEYTGLAPGEGKGWGWQATLHPEDLPKLLAIWRQLLASGQPGEIEARLRRYDGVYRWFLFRVNPLRDESGTIVKWYGTNTDIDELKRVELELRRSEARKATILDSALDCVVMIDHEGRITEFNPAAERTFGYRRDQVVGKHLADAIIPPSLREKHWQGLARHLATGETRVLGRRIETTAMRADGSEFPVELAITRMPLDGPPSFAGYLRDITERRRSEQKLRRSEALLAEGQRLSLTGTFAWYVETDEITWSEQVYRIFDLDPGTRLTLDLFRSRVHPDDLPLLNGMLDRARRNGSDFEHEHRLQMPDGSVKHLHVVAHGARDQQGRLEFIGAVQDVTQRRRSEEALAKARSELAHVARITSLGALTASIAHEVNQPLSGIITNASTGLRMLAAAPPNVEGARETVRRTLRDGNRAADVIARLRALFSRKDAVMDVLDLNEATREVIALSMSELRRGRVALRTELADDLPPVTGDRIQLQQVILNLLRNAADAMSEVRDRPRHLVIRTARDEGDQVRVTVQDAGVGLNPQEMDRLFQTFYTTKQSGMGIGLSVSRSIIENHRGRLWATPNEGHGATFSFSIPRQPTP
jgi:PAS domain S-box-containing protein